MDDADDWRRRVERRRDRGRVPVRVPRRGRDAPPPRPAPQPVARPHPAGRRRRLPGQRVPRQTLALADAWGQSHEVANVATLSYRIESDRVALTLRDLSGWFRDDPRPPAESAGREIARGAVSTRSTAGTGRRRSDSFVVTRIRRSAEPVTAKPRAINERVSHEIGMENEPAPARCRSVDLALLRAAEVWGGQDRRRPLGPLPGRPPLLAPLGQGDGPARGRRAGPRPAPPRARRAGPARPARVHVELVGPGLQGRARLGPTRRRGPSARRRRRGRPRRARALARRPRADRPADPGALAVALALWTDRLVGDLPERDDDPPVVVALTRGSTPRPSPA